jgi:hypothetical protein
LSVTAATLRLLVFRPAAAALVDASLRDEIVPALCDDQGVLDAYVARHGDEAGDRVIASVRRTTPDAGADELALLRTALPGERSALDAARIDVVPAEVAARFERGRPASILRVFRGVVRPGELAAYIAEARAGMEADAAINAGLLAFYLGRRGGDAFVTVSAWTDWDAIADATGGNVQRPFSTKQSGRLVDFAIDHYEVLPDTPRPMALAGGAPELLAS